MGQCSFLLTVLAFRCPLSVYSQIDSGCGIKIVAVFVSAKNTLSRHQPTNPDPGSVSTTSVQNKQPPAPNASNQNNQSTQTFFFPVQRLIALARSFIMPVSQLQIDKFDQLFFSLCLVHPVMQCKDVYKKM